MLYNIGIMQLSDAFVTRCKQYWFYVTGTSFLCFNFYELDFDSAFIITSYYTYKIMQAIR